MKRPTDKQKLDWLAKGPMMFYGDNAFVNFGPCDVVAQKNRVVLPLRQAIDAAMRAEAKGRGER